MKKSDIICRDRSAGYRPVEPASGHTVKASSAACGATSFSRSLTARRIIALGACVMGAFVLRFAVPSRAPLRD